MKKIKEEQEEIKIKMGEMRVESFYIFITHKYIHIHQFHLETLRLDKCTLDLFYFFSFNFH